MMTTYNARRKLLYRALRGNPRLRQAAVTFLESLGVEHLPKRMRRLIERLKRK